MTVLPPNTATIGFERRNGEVPAIVIRPSRWVYLVGLLWVLQGVEATLESGFGFETLFVAMGIVWIASQMLVSVTITRDLVAVRNVFVERLFHPDDVIVSTEPSLDGEGRWKRRRRSWEVGGRRFQPAVMVRPGLITESIRRMRGEQVQERKEPPFHGRVRTGFW